MEIQRISSLDRFLNSLPTPSESKENQSSSTLSTSSTNDTYSSLNIPIYIESEIILSQWWKKYLSLKTLKQKFHEIFLDISQLLETIHFIQNSSNITFNETQNLLFSSQFHSYLMKFLSILPRDPSLKFKKNQQVKNIQFFISAIMIQKFPYEILQQENNQPDDSIYTRNCIHAANLLLFAFQRLSSSIEKNLQQFRVSLIGYRYCVRKFLEYLDQWKQMDQERSQKYYEISYMDAYAILVSSQIHLENLNKRISDSNAMDVNQRDKMIQERDQLAIMVNETSSKIHHFRNALKQLLGKQRFDTRIEEIEAYVTASVNEAYVDMNELPTSPRSNQSSIPSQTENTSGIHLGKSLPSSPSIPISRERFQLERLSTFTGLHPNYILYELSLNPTYTIPLGDIQNKIHQLENQIEFLEQPPTLNPQDLNVLLRNNPVGAAGLLREQMLRVMGDRLVGALSLSTLTDYNEILENSFCFIWYGGENPPSGPDSTENGFWITAKVLKSHPETQSLDVQYHVDGIIENNIPFKRVKLQSHGRDYNRSGFLQNISEILNKTAEITSNKEFQSHVLRSVDIIHYQQMINHHAFGYEEIIQIMDTLVALICEIQSEIRKKEYHDWYQQKIRNYSYHHENDENDKEILLNKIVLFLPLYFEMAMTRIDELQLEISNFYLTMLGEYSIRNTPEILLQNIISQLLSLKGVPGDANTSSLMKFTDDDYKNFLPKTHQFVTSSLLVINTTNSMTTIPSLSEEMKLYFHECNLLEEEEEVTLQDLGQNQKIDLIFLAKAFCELLQIPFDFLSKQGNEYLPEVLLWDAERLSNLRSQIDSLAVISTLLLTIKQFLMIRKCRLMNEDEISFHSRLQELLTSDHITLPHLLDYIKQFISNLFIKQHILLPSSSLPLNDENTLVTSIKQSIASSSPVLQLFTKRIYKLVIKGLLSLPYLDILPSYSLQSKLQIHEIHNIINKSKRIYDHSVNIFGSLYSAILRQRVIALMSSN